MISPTWECVISLKKIKWILYGNFYFNRKSISRIIPNLISSSSSSLNIADFFSDGEIFVIRSNNPIFSRYKNSASQFMISFFRVFVPEISSVPRFSRIYALSDCLSIKNVLYWHRPTFTFVFIQTRSTTVAIDELWNY